MNIFLINHYAGSPKMGMEYRPYYLAQEWIKMGHDVTLLVANNSHIRSYNPEMSQEMKVEIIDGIRYVWINTPKYRENGISRVKNMLAFITRTLYKASYFVNTYKPDVVIASSTYPSDNYVARKMAKLSGAKYLYEVHDLWPLSPIELGGMSKHHPFILAMQHAESFAYRKADAVISMLPKTKEHMQEKGLDLKKWHYLPNGILIDEWKNQVPLNKEMQDEINAIREKYSKIIAYTGTFGVANALGSLIEAASFLKELAFVIVGRGPEKEKLLELAKSHDNVFVLETIPKAEIPSLLSNFDFLYIGLQYQALFRFGISPNKLIDYMMAGKPIIQAVKAGNNVVKEVGCGIDVEPENPKAIVVAINELLQKSKEELSKMGKRGQEFVLENHNYEVLAKRFINIIENIKKN